MAANAGTIELLDRQAKRRLIGNAADDEMGMLRVERAEGMDRLGDGVTGLYDLLSQRKVFTDEDIQIRNLVEHQAPPKKETPGECP